MSLPDWYEETLRRQLAMTPQTWAALQSHGVDELTVLRLDFSYDAPTEDGAEQLSAFLRLQTDYDVEVEEVGGRVTLSGSTHPTAVSQQVLRDWVGWMVAAGAEYGACRFDGWGAGAAGAPD